MRSDVVRQALIQRGELASDPYSVGKSNSLMRFSSHRALETLVSDLRRLPVDEAQYDPTPLQDASGAFFYDPEYSDPDGPDIV